jgi:hypothetical protein
MPVPRGIGWQKALWQYHRIGLPEIAFRAWNES